MLYKGKEFEPVAYSERSCPMDPASADAAYATARPITPSADTGFETPTCLLFVTGSHHLKIWAFDMDETIAFYEKAFGFRLLVRWDTVNAVREQVVHFHKPRQGAHLDMGNGQILELSPAPKEASRSNDRASTFHHMGLRVADLEASYERALANGAKPYPLRDDAGGVWEGPTTITRNARPPFTRSYKVRAAHVLGPNGEILELFEE